MIKGKYTTALALSLTLFLSSGCTPKQPDVSEAKIYDQYEVIRNSKSALENAEKDEADIFAPEGYAKATGLYEESIALAQKSRGTEGIEKAKQSLAVLNKAEADADQAKEVMREVIAHRELALEANAAALFPERFGDLDATLKTANAYIESGKPEKAKEFRPGLLKAYDAMQIEALEKGVVELARSSSGTARNNDAEEYAPMTHAAADEELEIVISILNADRPSGH